MILFSLIYPSSLHVFNDGITFLLPEAKKSDGPKEAIKMFLLLKGIFGILTPSLASGSLNLFEQKNFEKDIKLFHNFELQPQYLISFLR